MLNRNDIHNWVLCIRALHSPLWLAGMGHREFASAQHGNANPLPPELT
jgi:hypothetical protein